MKPIITAALIVLACIRVNAHEGTYTHIAKTAIIAEDPQHEWSVEDVAAGKYDDQFRPVTEEVENLNFTTSTWWVKFEITNGVDLSKSF